MSRNEFRWLFNKYVFRNTLMSLFDTYIFRNTSICLFAMYIFRNTSICLFAMYVFRNTSICLFAMYVFRNTSICLFAMYIFWKHIHAIIYYVQILGTHSYAYLLFTYFGTFSCSYVTCTVHISEDLHVVFEMHLFRNACIFRRIVWTYGCRIGV
jgi:hypothetical protein